MGVSQIFWRVTFSDLWHRSEVNFCSIAWRLFVTHSDQPSILFPNFLCGLCVTTSWSITVFIGSISSGVIGQRQYAYDVYSKDTKLANAMESGGIPGWEMFSASSEIDFECSKSPLLYYWVYLTYFVFLGWEMFSTSSEIDFECSKSPLLYYWVYLTYFVFLGWEMFSTSSEIDVECSKSPLLYYWVYLTYFVFFGSEKCSQRALGSTSNVLRVHYCIIECIWRILSFCVFFSDGFTSLRQLLRVSMGNSTSNLEMARHGIPTLSTRRWTRFWSSKSSNR